MDTSSRLEPPLIGAALAVQEYFCILQKHEDSHVVIAAVIYFSSCWDGRQKIGRSNAIIHLPVPEFAGGHHDLNAILLLMYNAILILLRECLIGSIS